MSLLLWMVMEDGQKKIISKKKDPSKRDLLKLIYIKCFLVSTEINQFLLHTNLISHQNSKYVMSNRPLS